MSTPVLLKYASPDAARPRRMPRWLIGALWLAVPAMFMRWPWDFVPGRALLFVCTLGRTGGFGPDTSTDPGLNLLILSYAGLTLCLPIALLAGVMYWRPSAADRVSYLLAPVAVFALVCTLPESGWTAVRWARYTSNWGPLVYACESLRLCIVLVATGAFIYVWRQRRPAAELCLAAHHAGFLSSATQWFLYYWVIAPGHWTPAYWLCLAAFPFYVIHWLWLLCRE